MTAPDLDALEKLADEGITLAAGRYTEKGIYRHAAIKALIAELREARGLLTDLVSWFDKPVQGERGMVWVIRAGDQGADDAITESRAALQQDG